VLRAVRSGNRAAQHEFDRRWRKRLAAQARRILRDDDLAQDAAQLALWRIFLNSDRYDSSRTFEPWVLRIARNCALDLLRKRRTRSAGRDCELASRAAGGLAGGVEQAARAEELAALRACIRELDSQARVLVELHYHGGFSHSEIGKLLGQPKSTVQSRLNRALRRLARGLARQGLRGES
jgi:RNA polymerase sigma-70 factor (ECF subfamily)